MADVLIGTSGWHYSDWMGKFYPVDVTGYNELRFYAERFGTVENNSSFYRISKESTYKTWSRMTPDGFKFSLKLNKSITHNHRLELTPEVEEKTTYILMSLQVLQDKLGAIVIQLPPSLKADLLRVETFLTFFREQIDAIEYKPDVAIEFRHASWFTDDTYAMLRKHNVALVAAQSSRYPGAEAITADVSYIRLHGPKELFASKYSHDELKQWAAFVKKASKTCKRVYVYFNNDFHGYALENAKELMEML